MSYILDALKKADRERTLGDVPDLETAHWGERHGGRSFRWIWVIVALLVVNGALLTFLLGRDESVEVSPLPPVAAPAEKTPAYTVPHVDTSAVQPSEKIMQPREPVYVPPPPVKRQLPAVQYMPATETAPAALESPADTSQETIPAAPPATPAGIPYWDELSLEFRSGLVLPHIDVHVYSDDPARRFVLVDLVKYREGETLESGAVIEVINEANIQLNYHGTRFLMER